MCTPENFDQSHHAALAIGPDIDTPRLFQAYGGMGCLSPTNITCDTIAACTKGGGAIMYDPETASLSERPVHFCRLLDQSDSTAIDGIRTAYRDLGNVHIACMTSSSTTSKVSAGLMMVMGLLATSLFL